MKAVSRTLGSAFAGAHLLLVLGIDLAIRYSHDGQAPLLWGVLAVVDFPVSLIYLGATLGPMQIAAEYIYLPYLVHGLVGTVWWFFIPTLLSRFASTVLFNRWRR